MNAMINNISNNIKESDKNKEIELVPVSFKIPKELHTKAKVAAAVEAGGKKLSDVFIERLVAGFESMPVKY